MSKNFRLIIISALILLLCTASILPANAVISNGAEQSAKASEQPEEQNAENYQRIIVCANKGNHIDYPENSIEAVNNTPAEYVSVDVRLTKDGIPVLMEDETVDRMCADKDAGSVTGRVDSFIYEEISEFYLKERTGGSVNKTDIKVPSLEDLISQTTGKIIVADIDYASIDNVLEVVNKEQIRKRVILRIDGKHDKIIDRLSKEDKVPNVIIKYNGNIIFDVNSAIDKASESGLKLVQLGTKNSHGVIFYDSVSKRFKEKGITALFSMTEPYNGGRNDNITGWDDVISRGYTFIETDYPQQLSEYVLQTENLKSELDSLIKKAEKYQDGEYPKDLKYEFTKAYNQALSVNENISSQSQIGSAYTALSQAIEALDKAGSTSTAKSLFHFSAGRIITVVLCCAAVAAAQIYFFKRRHPRIKKEPESDKAAE